MTPLVTIITPSYQTARWIGATIASVRAQTRPDWEMVIIDDGSRDGSPEAVAAAAGEDLGTRIILDATPGGLGAARARNRAIARARGRFIAFVDSDDLWYPAKLERQLAFMQRTGAALSHHAYEIVREDGSPTDLARRPPPRVGYRGLVHYNVIGCSTAIYDRERAGLVKMPDIARRQDHGLWLRILKAGHEALGLDEILGAYRLRAGSVSADKRVAAAYQWRLFREVEGMGPVRAAWTFGRYAARHLLGRRRERPMTPEERAARPAWPATP
ncbi:MAG: glycosyltransferase [Planctomycetes bacterium]|nr:glycosyltransferase [Planctomycetota bacterium]